MMNDHIIDKLQQSKSFSFQNLQPINYLKTFNKMLQTMGKTLPQQSTYHLKQLKLAKLSKFPLPSYYQQMQGILQGHHKKHHIIQKPNKKQLQIQQNQQQFIKKHHKFVKQALHKIIQDNQTQQKLLHKTKNFLLANNLDRNSRQYQQQILRLVRLRSQPKLRPLKKKTLIVNNESKDQQQNIMRDKLRQKREKKVQTDRVLYNKRDSSSLSSLSNIKKKSLNSHHQSQSSQLTQQQQQSNSNIQTQNINDTIINNKKIKQKNYHPLTDRNIYARQQLQSNVSAFSNMHQSDKHKRSQSIDSKIKQQFHDAKHLQKLPKKVKTIKAITQLPQQLSNDQSSNNFSNFESIVSNLQKQQTKAQLIFSNNLQGKIKIINQELNQRIKNVIKFDSSQSQNHISSHNNF